MKKFHFTLVVIASSGGMLLAMKAILVLVVGFYCLMLKAAAPDFPDPHMIRARDGFYYAYATGPLADSSRHISVSRSRDLKQWEAPREALPVKPVWSSRKKKFWAPHVVYHQGRYLMFYSAEPDWSEFEHMRLGLAVSRDPYGPFTDTGKAFDTGDAEENIDPMVFHDSTSGSFHLIWGRNGDVAIQELDASLTSFKRGSSWKTLLKPDGSNYEKIAEGPFLIFREGFYYLFYSGDDCCENPHYAVKVARSRKLNGNFQRMKLPLLTGNARWMNPGHNSYLREKSGKEWLITHAIDSRQPKHPVTGDVHRVLKLVPVRFHLGWPLASMAEAVGDMK